MTKAKTRLEVMTIGGRRFRSTGPDCTLSHDVWVMQQVDACGLRELEKQPGEAAEDFAQRLLLKAGSDPSFMTLLGGLIIPEGVDEASWSPEVAAKTAQFLMAQRDPADKLILRRAIAETFVQFFTFGIACLKTFPKSSTPSSVAMPFHIGA